MSTHLHPAQWDNCAMNQQLRRVASSKENCRVSQGESASCARLTQRPLEGSPKGLWAAGSTSGLPSSAISICLAFDMGRGTEDPHATPTLGRNKCAWEREGKDCKRLQGSSGSQRCRLRPGRPCLRRPEPGACVYRLSGQWEQILRGPLNGKPGFWH